MADFKYKYLYKAKVLKCGADQWYNSLVGREVVIRNKTYKESKGKIIMFSERDSLYKTFNFPLNYLPLFAPEDVEYLGLDNSACNEQEIILL